MSDPGDDKALPGSPHPVEGPQSTLTAGGGRAAAPRRDGVPAVDGERYERLELLGQGGMGVVFKARDKRLGRIVALKFIQDAAPERIKRFLVEARAQARIDHPHVCKVFEAGEVEGKAYIAMQLVSGQGLDRAAAGLSLPEKVRVMRDVAAAVHEAHRLGVIHRDLKPSNILLDRGEEGERCFPLVVDFGLAYDASGGHALTDTGALLGTPAYMAPEQARGDLPRIDRRTDVYSLGATLYELLTGVAPFDGASPLGTLAKVLHEEPVPPRARVAGLPEDLETVVLKCLNKEQEQRYPSARELAEDLGRWLDGEPIRGRRPSLRYRLLRRARKHRALVAVSAVSLASILVLSVLGGRSWLEARHTRSQLAARARLAEGLGQQVKAVELLLRTVWSQPLHDTGHVQPRVRERMARIAAQAHDLEAHGEALIQYALGRGHLALQELEPAHEALTRARRLGLDSPELHYALGQVLGELYQRALEEARRSGGKDWVAGRQRALEQQYLAPALQSLERSRGLELESPRYLEGLIAFYRKEYGAAARAAAQALVDAPWMYEAHRLTGDVARARALESLERGDYDTARAGLLEAVAQYGQAIESGRSDARNYEALAQAWLEHADADRHQGKSPKAALEHTLAATAQSALAAPWRAISHTQKAYALMRLYRLENAREASPVLGTLLSDWLAAGSRAVELDPGNVYAHDALGIGYYTRGLHEVLQLRDPHPSWNEAITWLKRALALQPDYPWALNDLALVYFDRGNYLVENGQDPRSEFADAAGYFARAVESDPRYLYAFSNLALLHNALARYHLSRGLDPEEQVQKALDAGARGLAVNASYYSLLSSMAVAELIRAQYQLESGGDPRPALGRALQQVHRALRSNPAAGRSHLYEAEVHYLEARLALREKGDPGASLQAGRQSLERAYRDTPSCVDCQLAGVRMGLAAAEWARRQGRPELPLLQKALAEARHAVKTTPYFGSHQELARVYWRLAQALPPASAGTAITEGLGQVERALGFAPGLPHAQAIRGGLLLARARGTGRPVVERLETARQARSALDRAFEANPLLRREYEGAAREADALIDRLTPAREGLD